MDVFHAVAEPTRREILDLLAVRERSAGELVATFPRLTQPAVSRHLGILLKVGLVASRPEAQRRIYSIRAARLAELDVWLQRYRRFWSDRLDALGDHLNKRAANKNSPSKSSNKKKS